MPNRRTSKNIGHRAKLKNRRLVARVVQELTPLDYKDRLTHLFLAHFAALEGYGAFVSNSGMSLSFYALEL